MSGLRTALALALVAAVSLGLSRFSYALLLPPMREDLAWSYTTGGAMNTVNADGYLLGALTATVLARVYTPQEILDWAWRLPFLLGGVFGVLQNGMIGEGETLVRGIDTAHEAVVAGAALLGAALLLSFLGAVVAFSGFEVRRIDDRLSFLPGGKKGWQPIGWDPGIQRPGRGDYALAAGFERILHQAHRRVRHRVAVHPPAAANEEHRDFRASDGLREAPRS